LRLSCSLSPSLACQGLPAHSPATMTMISPPFAMTASFGDGVGADCMGMTASFGDVDAKSMADTLSGCEPCPVSPMTMGEPFSSTWAKPTKKPSRTSSSAMRVWEYEEDQILMTAVSKLGKRWRAISRLFHDRSEAMCRNRHARIFAPMRTEMKGWKPSVNRCNACGQLKKGHSCPAKGKLFVNAETALVSEPEPPTVLARPEPQFAAPPSSPPLLLQSSSTLASMLQPDVEFLTDPAPAPAPAVQATAMPAPIPPPLLPECSDERIPLAELLCRMDSRE